MNNMINNDYSGGHNVLQYEVLKSLPLDRLIGR